MIDESQTITEEVVDTTLEPGATAAPEVEKGAEHLAQPEDDEVVEKTFTQKEVDDMIAKRLAREERKRNRAQPETPMFEAPSNDDEQPVDPQKIIEQYEATKQRQEIQDAYGDREEAALEKYDDFEQVAKNPNLPVSEYMAQAIMASDVGPDVLYWLGSNPKDAARIAKQPPLMQAREIGKIEASLEANPPVKKTSSAPTPISPVVARNNGASVYDTTDPRSTKSMTTSEWIEADRLRRFKEVQARR